MTILNGQGVDWIKVALNIRSPLRKNVFRPKWAIIRKFQVSELELYKKLTGLS
jgi:hypothetical protein